jgi:glycosyltransferase involved in cell wall biosynthesis
MKIWLVNPYGPIPGEGWRDYRFTLLGRTLAAQGHEVIWWTANFAHHFKRYRSNGWKDCVDRSGFTIRLVPTHGYTRNIGLGRVIFELLFAWRVYNHARVEERPDVIVGVDPSQVIGTVSRWMSVYHHSKFVLDVFDLWPELFTLALPSEFHAFSRSFFAPLYAMRRVNYRAADGLCALCETYLEVARRDSGKLEVPSGVFFNGIDVLSFRSGLITDVEKRELERHYGKAIPMRLAVYAGSLGPNYDIPTLLEASKLLSKRKIPVRILVAGSGPLEPSVREFVARNGSGSLYFLGKLDPSDLVKLYSVCDIGICAYGQLSNVAMPDKFYDYSAAGLAVVNSLRGELDRLLIRENAGLSYRAGDAGSLADALETLVNDPALLEQFRTNAARIAEAFDAKVQYARMAEFVESVAGRSS